MPTPFSHLVVAQRLLRDDSIAPDHRALFAAESGAFLLGNIAADARVGSGAPREYTHFYGFAQEIHETPWRVMLREHPSMWTPRTPAQRAFAAGYVAHLAMDEVWSRQMVAPHFIARDWGGRSMRILMLHIILIYMDERDRALIEPWQADALAAAQPEHWVNFMTDDDLRTWQHLIQAQIAPGGVSRTLEIFGARIGYAPVALRSILDSPDRMQTDLWDNIPRAVLAQVEDAMLMHIRHSVAEYCERSVVTST